ncbi:hypothetical protein H4R18_000264 [Coemansia javaensis]|uniref:FAD dependent oxidoreductase domain-containing protein n=1 Tax=Coemansia javaensis TaxID=2761396 RepID=A0A9W8LN41_9FUNG|nr:hypothetical protein H4R18_000264 [Coemansia javaensis]
MAPVAVVVVGSGVVGLTTALCLQRSGRYSVTVVARDVPGLGDSASQAWASPYAGANWRPYAALGDTQQRAAEEETYFCLRDIAACQPWAGVRVATMRDFGAGPKEERVPPFLGYVRNLKPIARSEWPAHAWYGYSYDSLVVNVPQHLLWLRRELCGLGGAVRQGELADIRSAPGLAGVQAAAVVNCAGLGSRALGVNDAAMFPTRGQTLLVRAPAVDYTTTAPAARNDRAAYVIPRGDGTVIIGGVFEQGSADPDEHAETTEEILRSCIALCPQLLDRGPEHLQRPEQVPERDVERLRQRVIRTSVGFRPSRKGGPRLEVQRVGGLLVLHNYGHSSLGYQSSWGYAAAAVRLLDAALFAQARL